MLRKLLSLKKRHFSATINKKEIIILADMLYKLVNHK